MQFVKIFITAKSQALWQLCQQRRLLTLALAGFKVLKAI